MKFPLSIALAVTATVAHAQSDTPSTVVVAGKRADVINKIDRKVYRAEADIQASTGSAVDLLNNIPAVDVDIDGNVSLRGDTSVTVLIDGKPSSQMQGAARGGALMGFSAADIEQIEVITSPSAEFKPDGAGGIINIVTKKNRKPGSSGQLLANLGNEGRHNGALSGAYKAGSLDLSGTLGNRLDQRRRISDSLAGTRGVDPTGSHQVLDESNDRWYGKGAVKYSPDDKQTLGLTLDYVNRTEHRISEQDTTPASSPAYQRSGDGGGPRTDAGIMLSLDQKLALPGEALSLYLQRSHSVETNLYDYRTYNADPALQRDFSQQVYDISKFSGSYVRPTGEAATLKLGYEVEYNHNGFNNWSAQGDVESTTANPAADNHFRYRQAVNAAYGTYAFKHGALETLTGLRVEQVDIHSLQRVSGDTSAQHYRKLYPTLNLLYTLSDNDLLSLGYSRRVKKPDPEDLNPYINAADPKNLRQGNPSLRPQVTDALELGYRHEAGGASYGVTAYYRRSRDGDTEVLTPLGNDVVLVTKANMPGNQSGGLEFSAAGKFWPGLSYNLSGNGFYNQIDGQALGYAAKRSNVGLNGKGTLDYQLSARDRVQLGLNYRGKRLTPQGYILPFTVLNLGYRRQIDEQWTLVATLSDAFNTQRMRRVYETPTFSGVYRRQQMGQIAYLGFAYSFGGARKSKDADFNYE
ncbi:TonB-dependent receptor [Duganella sp. FT80W]|uniref:TonB-dependent receptor n=1 Tax=Duganella guangzhouensis TaxID=2666084 RepID=A0A6I2KWI2_9BURK|nr:outer membrane beta-barrel family protein [Duganella guangzhouensis]MRW89912.1 TonB-dependent receptor [Duganella guangzhouensis]